MIFYLLLALGSCLNRAIESLVACAALVLGFHYNVCLVFCQLKFNICVRCDMAFIKPMHRNKANITYLLTYLRHIDTDVSSIKWHLVDGE